MDSIAGFLTDGSGSAFVATIALKTTAVLSAGLLLCGLLKTASASARHLVLVFTLVATILIPAIAVVMPPLNLAIDVSATSFEPVYASPITTTAAPMSTSRTSPGRTDATVPTVAISPAQPQAPTIRVIPFVAIISMLLAAYLGLGIVRLWRISGKAVAVPNHDEWYELIPTESRSRVALLLSEVMPAPYTWGFFKPVIVLPTQAQTWNRRNKTNALLHELSHIDRHDWLFQMIARFACSLHWYNPLIWMVYRRLVLEAERAADDRVLLSGSKAHDYAEQLVELAKSARASNRLPLAATTMAADTLLTDRVHSILNTGVHRMPFTTLHKLAVFVSMAILSLTIGSTHLVAADDARYALAADDSGIPPLIQAVAKGDQAEVAQLIAEGADVNETANTRRSHAVIQRTALTTAAKGGHADIVAMLIDKGAPVDRVVRGDATALIEALKQNHADVARLLLNRGADVNLTVRGDGSPLIAAAMADSYELLSLLLQKGADPDVWVRGDGDPLFHAAGNGNLRTVQLLIDAGVNVNRSMRGDGNALINATRNGHSDVVKALLNAGARADETVKGDGNAMISAAQRGETDQLAMMIASGADVNASMKGDGSPLIAAARNGHPDAVRLLLKNGADIDKIVTGDENALIGAAWAGDLAMVELLLEAGADPNIRAKSYNEEYRSALRQATLAGHTEVVKALKYAGATVY